MPAKSTISNKRLREMERIVHIIGGALLLVYVYAPWNDISVFTLLVRLVVFPVLVGSGFAMWQLPRLRRWLNARRASTGHHA